VSPDGGAFAWPLATTEDPRLICARLRFHLDSLTQRVRFMYRTRYRTPMIPTARSGAENRYRSRPSHTRLRQCYPLLERCLMALTALRQIYRRPTRRRRKNYHDASALGVELSQAGARNSPPHTLGLSSTRCRKGRDLTRDGACKDFCCGAPRFKSRSPNTQLQSRHSVPMISLYHRVKVTFEFFSTGGSTLFALMHGTNGFPVEDGTSVHGSAERAAYSKL
jgi:hypothetical protein